MVFSDFIFLRVYCLALLFSLGRPRWKRKHPNSEVRINPQCYSLTAGCVTLRKRYLIAVNPRRSELGRKSPGNGRVPGARLWQRNSGKAPPPHLVSHTPSQDPTAHERVVS